MAANRSAHILFTPDNWPAEPPITVSDDFGIVTIDGATSTMSEIASLLEVTTIRGDESLQDTVRAHIQQVESHIYQTATMVRSRANETDEFLAQFSSDWLRADPDVVASHTVRLEGLSKDLVAAQEGLRNAERVSADLDRALELRRKLASADTDVRTMLARQSELKQQVSNFESVIVALEAQSEAAEAALAAQGGSAAELSAAEKTLRTRESRSANQLRDLAQLAAINDLAPEQTAITAALIEANKDYERLAQQVDVIDRGRRIHEVLNRMLPVLEATTIAASDDILMVIDEMRFTGKQVKGGLRARSKEISDSPLPDEVQATVAQLDDAKRRLARLNAFKEAFIALGRTDKLVKDGTAALKAAQGKATGATQAAATLRDVHAELGTVQADLTAAHQESVDLQERIGLNGVTSAKEAKAALYRILGELGLVEADLGEAQAVAIANVRGETDRVARIRESIQNAQSSTDEALGNIRTLVAEVTTAAHYQWLREALSKEQLRAFASGSTDILRTIRSSILEASDVVFAAVGELEGLARLAHVLAEDKPSKSDTTQLEQKLGEPMARALGESLRQALNSESIRQRVFSGMEVLGLDLQGQVIVLGENGREERRPMSAFSTGERAFAFTQARIKDLPISTKPNRLLVLDEFGAFISADRMADLREFLETLSDIADQIVIILPLQVNYQAELKDTRGQLKERYEERIRQLDAHGYLAVPL